MEIGSVSIGVGYELDQTAPRRFEQQQGRLAASTNRFQTSLGSIAQAAARAGVGIEGVVRPADQFIDTQQELNRLGIKTTAQLEDQVRQLRRLRDAYKDDTAVVQNLDNRIDGLNRQLGTTGGASRQATNAVIQLGRGLEDAAFGFIGVANNIPVILEGFGRLRTQAQLTGTSVASALKGALLGPAGLIFLFQAASFAILTFGDDIVAAFRKGREAATASAKEIKGTLTDIITVASPEVAFEIEAESIDQAIALAQARLQATTEIFEDARSAFQSASLSGGVGLGRAGASTGRGSGPGQGGRRFTQEQINALNEQRKIAKERLTIAEELLANLKAQKREIELTNRIAEQTKDTLGGLAFDTSTGDIDVPEVAPVAAAIDLNLDTGNLQQEAEKLLRQLATELPPLPAIDTSEAEDSFDQFARKSVVLQRQIDAGILSESQEVAQRIALLTQLFRGLATEGVDVSSEAFAQYRTELASLVEQQATAKQSNEDFINSLTEAEIAERALLQTTFLIGEGFVNVFAEAVTGVRDLEDALGSLQGILRRTLSRLISAGFTAGLGALTGGGSFGSLFLGQLGIPGLAEGGVVTGPTLAQIGERGAEAVIPLDRLDVMFDRLVTAARPDFDMRDFDQTLTERLSALQVEASLGAVPRFSEPSSTNVPEPSRPVETLSGPRTVMAEIDASGIADALSSAVRALPAPTGAAVTPNQAQRVQAGGEFFFRFDTVRIAADALLLLVREAEKRQKRNHGF